MDVWIVNEHSSLTAKNTTGRYHLDNAQLNSSNLLVYIN